MLGLAGPGNGTSMLPWMQDLLSDKPTYKLRYIKGGSTAFKVQKDGCGIPSA